LEKPPISSAVQLAKLRRRSNADPRTSQGGLTWTSFAPKCARKENALKKITSDIGPQGERIARCECCKRPDVKRKRDSLSKPGLGAEGQDARPLGKT